MYNACAVGIGDFFFFFFFFDFYLFFFFLERSWLTKSTVGRRGFPPNPQFPPPAPRSRASLWPYLEADASRWFFLSTAWFRSQRRIPPPLPNLSRIPRFRGRIFRLLREFWLVGPPEFAVVAFPRRCAFSLLFGPFWHRGAFALSPIYAYFLLWLLAMSFLLKWHPGAK